MRICVAHLISFLIITIPMILNTMFLLRNYKEYFELNDSLKSQTVRSNPKSRVLEEMVQKRMQTHSNELKNVKQQLKEIDDDLTQYTDANRSRKSLSETNTCNTSHRINFADESLGARVQSVRDEPIDQSYLSSMVGLIHSTNPPVNALRSNMFPGNCYAFRNTQAELEIKLAKKVFVDFIEMEHIPKSRSPTKDTSSAPKNFSVFGLDAETGNEIYLGDFEFSNTNPCELFELSVKQSFQILRFKFKTNHGNPDYTCVYRIAVYGKPNV